MIFNCCRGEKFEMMKNNIQSIFQHYIDLNEPYMSTNLDHLKSHPDYLTQFSAPAVEAPKPPLAEEENFYVNEPPLGGDEAASNLPNTPSYVAMSPKSGTVRYRTDNLELPEAEKEANSPTLARNLDSSPKRKYESKVPIPEEIPMLRTSRDSNDDEVDEDDHQNGYTEMSFSNPQPKPTQRSISTTDYINVFKSNENYVNVPTNNATISNPSYITISGSPEEK
jgi:hypothetical protein